MAGNDEYNISNLEGRPRRRKQTKKKELQKKDRNNVEMEYNSYGVPVGKGRNELRTYIGIIVRETISILHDDWRRVPLQIKESLWIHFQVKFMLSLKCKSQVLKWMGIACRNFRHELTHDYILPNKDDRQSLRLPPIEFPSIKKEDWKCFVDKVLSDDFQEISKKAKDTRAMHEYNHRLGSTGYSGMFYRMSKEGGVSEREVDRSEAWMMARADRSGNYAPEVKPMVEKISELKSQVVEGTFKPQGGDDILGEAIQKKPNGSRVQGVGQFITPSMYFHVPDATDLAIERKMYQESFQFMTAQLELLTAKVKANSTTEVVSSNVHKLKNEYDVQFEKDCDEILGKRKASPKSIKSKVVKTIEATPKKMDVEVASKHTFRKTPRRSPRLTSPKSPAKEVVIKSSVNEIVMKELAIAKKHIAKKLIYKKIQGQLHRQGKL